MSNVLRQPWMDDSTYEWYYLEEQARVNTLERLHRGGNRALIAVKAQHPLNADGTPGKEYTLRLCKALKVKTGLEADGVTVDFVTFGGVHQGHPMVTLAEAGRDYLVANGIGQEHIKSFNKIYSGNDEDRIAAEEFSNGDYSQLHVVCSAGQWERARLFYIFMGWQPFMHAVTFLEERPNHSMICELWGSWGVPAFANGPESIKLATDEIVRKHLSEA